MSYKLISLDLDGTLLDDKKAISTRNQAALQSAAARNVKIVINTGRILPEALALTNSMPFVSAISSSNGARIVSADGESILYEKPICRELYTEIVRSLDKTRLFYCVYGSHAIYIPNSSAVHLDPMFASAEGRFCRIETSDDFLNDARFTDNPVFKINVLDRDTEAIGRFRTRFGARMDLEFTSSGPYNLEMTSKGVHKGNALHVLGEAWNIRSCEMVAFGDGENDIRQFEYVGVSFAMGNAPGIVQRAASRVISTNQEDGIAKAIEEIL